MTSLDIAGLTTRIVGPPDASMTVVLLHGFGAPGDDLVALASYLDAPARYVFPAAPLELGGIYGESRAQGMGPGAQMDMRAWWLLDLAKLEQELRSGVPRDRSDEIPEGLPNARAQMLRFLDQLQARYSIPDDKLVLGGFSQGAMLALDVALHRTKPPAGLILMSPTWVAAKDWEPRFTALAGVPIVMSHGRNDMLLPFSVSEALRDRLRAAGANVDWHQFVGGHEIPPAVLEAAGAFVRASR